MFLKYGYSFPSKSCNTGAQRRSDICYGETWTQKHPYTCGQNFVITE